MAIGFGIVYESVDLTTWTPGTSPYGDIVVAAENTALVQLPPPGNGAITIAIAPTHDRAVYKNGLLLHEDDGTGIDYAYDAGTGLATLAVPLRSRDVLSVDLAISMTITLSETPSGTINGSNPTFTLAHTPTTNVRLFRNGRAYQLGTDYTVSGTTITTVTFVPTTGQLLTAMYGY